MERNYAIIISLVFAFYLYRIISGRLKFTRLTKLMESGAPFTLIDVRTSGEYALGHIPGAKNISHDIIGSSLGKTAKDREIVVYCQSGSRASAAKAALAGKGYTNVWNFGGLSRWKGKLEK